MTTTTHPIGFVDQTDDEYHQGPGISKSDLDLIARSPLHYWARKLDPERDTHGGTDAMVLGSAVHAAVLQPDLFASRYATIPDDAPRRPTDRQINAKAPSAETLSAVAFWRDFERANAGKELLTPDQFTTALRIRDSVLSDPLARRAFEGCRAEQSVHAIDPETGEHIKCRIDALQEGMGLIADLKTTEDASEDAFSRSVATYRYYIQQPWYQDVCKAAFGEAPPYWVFVAVEKKSPYAVAVYELEPADIALGRIHARRDLTRLLECRRTGVWPGYTNGQVAKLALPAWFTRRAENELV